MNIAIKKKFVVILLIIIVLSGCIFAGLIYLDNSIIKEVDISKMDISEGKVIYNVDDIDNDKNKKYISVRGWAFVPGKDISIAECYVGVINTSTNVCYRLNTIKESRVDVTSHFNDGFTYDNSGFYAFCEKRMLKKGSFEICLIYLNDNNNLLVRTDKIITIK